MMLEFRLLWVEDQEDFYKTKRGAIEAFLEKNNLKLDINWLENGTRF